MLMTHPLLLLWMMHPVLLVSGLALQTARKHLMQQNSQYSELLVAAGPLADSVPAVA
jgi:hypothetical protein